MLKTTLLASTALVLAAGAASAQQALRPGSTDGELGKGDSQLRSGEFVDFYEFTGRAGDQVTLALTSVDFDAYLIVTGPDDFQDENDDGPSGTHSALTVRLPADGTYRVGATTYASGEDGRYTLDFRTGGAAAPAMTAAAPSGSNSLQVGAPARDSLARGDQQLDSGEYADRWNLQVQRGQTYTVRLDSDDFDPYLMLRSDGGLSEDNDDDPDRGSTDSRITFTAVADEQVRINATSYAPGETGAYTLSVEQGGGAAPAQSGAAIAQATDGAIRIGDAVNGQLSSGSVQLNSGEYINSYSFSGRQGQVLDISMTSGAFDAFIQIEGPNGFSAFNDDDPQGDSTDSRLITTLPADGAYNIYATSYAGGETGSYRLAVQDGAGYQAPSGPQAYAQQDDGVFSIGDSVEGVLQAGDTTLSSGEYVDYFTFQGQRGQQVAVELTSSAFDAYTILLSPSGEQYDNDDGEFGTDSRLITTLEESGEYRVAVTSYSPGETGSYRFSVTSGAGVSTQPQVPVAGGQRVFAIMVGIADYGGNGDLPYTDEDAMKLAEDLRRAGVLNPASVTLTNAQATMEGVRGAFRQIAAQAGPNDIFMFFFSGHGSQTDRDPSMVNAMEPDGRTESIVLRDGFMSDTEMAQLFGTLNTRLSMLVLDSCFSGGFARNVVSQPGVMGLFSSEEDLTSQVAGKFEAGGYLAHFLRTGLAGGADEDGNTMVTAGELSTYLRRQFTAEVSGVTAETMEGQRNYQNLVIDRGGVQVDDVVVQLAYNQTRGGF